MEVGLGGTFRKGKASEKPLGPAGGRGALGRACLQGGALGGMHGGMGSGGGIRTREEGGKGFGRVSYPKGEVSTVLFPPKGRQKLGKFLPKRFPEVSRPKGEALRYVSGEETDRNRETYRQPRVSCEGVSCPLPKPSPRTKYYP